MRNSSNSSVRQFSLQCDTQLADVQLQIVGDRHLRMPPDTIIYRDHVTTKVLSVFSDDKWWNGPIKTDSLDFSKIKCVHCRDSAKSIMHILAKYPISGGRLPAPKTICGYFSAIKYITLVLSRHDDSENCLLDFFSDFDIQRSVANAARSDSNLLEELRTQQQLLEKGSPEHKKISAKVFAQRRIGASKFGLEIQSVFGRLYKIGSEKLNFTISTSEYLDHVASAHTLNKLENKGQHVVIPPDVYSELFSTSLAIVSEFLDSNFDESTTSLLTHYCDLVNTGGSGNGFPPAKNRKGYQNRLIRFLTSEVIKKPSASLRNYNWDYSKSCLSPTISVDSWFYGCQDRSDVSDKLNTVRLHAYWLILMQGGMRESEAITLPLKPLESVTVTKDSLAYLVGWTTKYTGGSQGKWVLGEAGQAAHAALTKIAEFIYKLNLSDAIPGEKFLFINNKISIDEHGNRLNNQHHLTPAGLANTTRAHEGRADMTPRVPIPCITQSDFEFLKLYSQASKVQWHKFSLGEPWPLTPHQFRRSFAFYSLATGLATVAGVKRQLHHLSKEISEYYGTQDGNELLHQFFLDEESRAMIDTESSVLNAMNYLEAITSGKPLLGAGGLNLEKHLVADEAITIAERKMYAAENKEKILKQAHEGRLKAKKTPLGICTSTEECDPYSLGLFTTCIGCDNAIHDIQKITRAREILEQQKTSADDWMEIRMVSDQLSEISQYEEKLRRREERIHGQ